VLALAMAIRAIVVVPQRTCPNCTTHNSITRRRCKNCGYQFT
jgi:transposase-like protein